MTDNRSSAGSVDAKILASVRTRGNPYPYGSDLFEAFENGRRPAFDPRGSDFDFDRLTDLVSRFSSALLDKLKAAEVKYGHNSGWMRDDWMADCQRQLGEHLAKGDPRDVAAYCAFMWHHGWSTVAPAQGARKYDLRALAKFLYEHCALNPDKAGDVAATLLEEYNIWPDDFAAQPPAALVETAPTYSSIETCRECGASDPCDEDCPNYVEPDWKQDQADTSVLPRTPAPVAPEKGWLKPALDKAERSAAEMPEWMRRSSSELAAPVETRKTFTIPDGYETVRDGEGQATGEVRPVKTDDITESLNARQASINESMAERAKRCTYGNPDCPKCNPPEHSSADTDLVTLLFAASDEDPDPEFKELLREAANTIGAQAMRLGACDAEIARLTAKPQAALDWTGAHKLASLIVDFTDNNLSMFDACDMPSDKAAELYEQAKALRDRLALSLPRPQSRTGEA